MTDIDTPPRVSRNAGLAFKASVHQVFPDRSSARAARLVGVGQRSMQKWMAGEADAPDDVAEVMARQGRVVAETRVCEHLEGALKDFLAAGGHPEVVGSILSALHKRVLGKPIE